MFKTIKDEISKRKQEEKEIKEAVNAVKDLLEEERQKARKSILRKIKFVDDIKTRTERKRDEKRVETLSLRLECQVNDERQERKSVFLQRTRGRL